MPESSARIRSYPNKGSIVRVWQNGTFFNKVEFRLLAWHTSNTPAPPTHCSSARKCLPLES